MATAVENTTNNHPRFGYVQNIMLKPNAPPSPVFKIDSNYSTQPAKYTFVLLSLEIEAEAPTDSHPEYTPTQVTVLHSKAHNLHY